jgi:hypothetical protein
LSGSFVEFIKTVLNENSLAIVSHPPSSPDLAPSDFWLFEYMKTSLAGPVFNDADEFLEAVIDVFIF